MATKIEKSKTPVWRESSSLIVCAKSPEIFNGYDYRILMLKRSDQTALFNNQCVFPGGIFDPFDESIEWLKYFEEFGVTQQSLRELVVIDSKAERPKILAHQGSGCYDRFFKNSKIWAREISLRINAIRETFEEVGVFLCRTRHQLNAIKSEGFYKLEFDISKWQKLVHDDASEFINMCREYNVVPDLWGLYEWCGWASPAIVKKGYETAFFITFLNVVPKVICEESEVKDSSSDDFYNRDPCEDTVPRHIDCTKNEFRTRTKRLNRIENPGDPNAILYSNIEPLNGHLMPVSGDIDKLHKL